MVRNQSKGTASKKAESEKSETADFFSEARTPLEVRTPSRFDHLNEQWPSLIPRVSNAVTYVVNYTVRNTCLDSTWQTDKSSTFWEVSSSLRTVMRLYVGQTFARINLQSLGKLFTPAFSHTSWSVYDLQSPLAHTVAYKLRNRSLQCENAHTVRPAWRPGVQAWHTGPTQDAMTSLVWALDREKESRSLLAVRMCDRSWFRPRCLFWRVR